jgi:hypothetical protein
MTALLRYLDACDSGDGVVVAGIGKIERGVRLEVSRRHKKVFDLTDRYMESAGDISDHSDEGEVAILGGVQDMRSHSDGRTAELEVDLAPLAQRGAER